jgi:hypothetical protein
MVTMIRELMKRHKISKILIGIILTLPLFYSCQEGLEPPPPEQKSFIGGKITFIGGSDNWPPEDSVYAVRVVAFKDYPPQDIITELISGNAYFTLESLPFFVDTATFSIEIPETPVTFQYIAVALQYTDDIMTQRAIGVYTLTGDKTQPSQVELNTGERINDLDIEVDFNDLPPQPF